MKPSNTITSGKATDMYVHSLVCLAHIYKKRHVMLNITSTGVCNTGTSAMYVFNLLLWLTWWWMLYRTLSEVTWVRIWEKDVRCDSKMCCCSAAVVSAVVLRRPTKECTHPHSMMHRSLPTAGMEVASHYHQLLVQGTLVFSMGDCWSYSTSIPDEALNLCRGNYRPLYESA